ncbi:hypothetical protein [Streptomyces albogriseolus]|uniref:hypothetical protein n=1 Tax=Streptomyces albogriseolus TaxID=1887 RepID=UPI0034614FEA
MGRKLIMIVFPRLLSDLLDEMGGPRAGHLALDFAWHVLDLEREGIEEPVLSACLEYIEAAHEAIDLGEAVPRLLEVRERLDAVAERRVSNMFFLAGEAQFTVDAARVGVGLMLDKAYERGPFSHPSCLSVARQLQAEVGRWAVQHSEGGADERLVARRARWEEARWQVLHILRTEPNPHNDAG